MREKQIMWRKTTQAQGRWGWGMGGGALKLCFVIETYRWQPKGTKLPRRKETRAFAKRDPNLSLLEAGKSNIFLVYAFNTEQM